MLNASSLEAADDLRNINAIGAALGGKESADYIGHLAESAFWDNPARVANYKMQLAAADANRGFSANGPPV